MFLDDGKGASMEWLSIPKYGQPSVHFFFSGFDGTV